MATSIRVRVGTLVRITTIQRTITGETKGRKWFEQRRVTRNSFTQHHTLETPRVAETSRKPHAFTTESRVDSAKSIVQGREAAAIRLQDFGMPNKFASWVTRHHEGEDNPQGATGLPRPRGQASIADRSGEESNETSITASADRN